MADLTAAERAMLDGSGGRGRALAMRIVLAAARAVNATQLRPITAAHIDSCLYHGPSSLDFVNAVRADDTQVAVPATLNVGSLDFAHRQLVHSGERFRASAAALMHSYVSLGCAPTFTCAPYQLPGRPAYGEHVAWAESNAIAFGNSVLGLRTNRYGDLLDICAAVTGRVPDAGLHLESNRAAQAVFTLTSGLANSVDRTLLPALLGHHVGKLTGSLIPAVIGLDTGDVDEDWMKSFGAAAASSGSVALFHLVGITPDAATLDHALHGSRPATCFSVTRDDLRSAHAELCTTLPSTRLGGVSLGTPHLSSAELIDIAHRLDGQRVRVPTYLSTSRSCLAAVPGAPAALADAGVQIVLDTCTYITAIMNPLGVVLTDSAKWAYYAPGNLGFDVILASRPDCLASALTGHIRLSDLP